MTTLRVIASQYYPHLRAAEVLLRRLAEGEPVAPRFHAYADAFADYRNARIRARHRFVADLRIAKRLDDEWPA